MANIFAPLPWPGFQPDGGLLLPLPAGSFVAGLPDALDWQGATLKRKHECHVTLLNRACGSVAREALGEAGVRSQFESLAWSLRRTGDARLLRQPGTPDAYSLIEDVTLPALCAFRETVSRAISFDVPAMHPHVTLYTAGKPEGIGLPDLDTLARLEIARMRLPGIHNRPPPELPSALKHAYRTTDYVVGSAPGLVINIGQPTHAVDMLLATYNAARGLLLSACNPYSEASSDTANQLRHALLTSALQDLGLRALAAGGRDPTGAWPPEPSLLVLGTTAPQEHQFLRDYEQHAAVLLQRGRPAELLLHPDTVASRSS